MTRHQGRGAWRGELTSFSAASGGGLKGLLQAQYLCLERLQRLSFVLELLGEPCADAIQLLDLLMLRVLVSRGVSCMGIRGTVVRLVGAFFDFLLHAFLVHVCSSARRKDSCG